MNPNDNNSLAHTMAFAPKKQKKVFYVENKAEIEKY